MKVLLSAIAYMMIGGVMVSIVNNGIFKECGYRVPVDEAINASPYWPAIIAYVAVSTDSSPFRCSKSEL